MTLTESAVDELMKLSQQCDSEKSRSKFDTSLYDEDLSYQAIASKPQQSSQNLNYYNFSPHSTKTEKSNVKQFNGFHDVKVVYKGENSEDEADADIIIEEEDVYNEQGLKVLHESTAPFETNILLNAIASHSPASIPNRVKNNPKTLNSDFEKLNVDNVAFQKNVIAQRYAPSAPTLNTTETNVGLPDTTSIHVIYQECSEIVDTVDRVCSLVLNSIKVMILLRGCPGSGKSFMAEKMVMNVNKIRPHMNLKLKDHVFSTDDYFMSPKHGYRFDAKMLPQAHDWNKNRAHKALLKNVNPVIIDNTNTQIWEMAPYVQLGVQYGYVVEVAEPETKWKFNEYELFRRNIHGVPRANIRNMLERYEHGITKNNILQMLKCQYHPSNHPPQIDAAGGMNVSRNTPKDNTAPFKGNGWPANFAQPSTDLPTCSFPPYEQKGDNNQNSRLLKNDLSTCSFPSYEQKGNYNQNDSSSKEDKYSNLTASCRSFFENSLLSSASGSDGFKVASNEASGAKMNREQNDRSRASSRNALLSSMLKDCTMPDVVAKSPTISLPQGWLTFNNQVMPKPVIGDAKVANIEEKSTNLIDFGSRKNMSAPSESDTIKDELFEVTGMMSKVDITKQHQSISACSSDVSKKLDTDLYENMDLKGSLNSENNNPLLETLPNVTELEYPKIETGNLTEKIKTECLMDEDDPASTIHNNDLMPCLSVNKIPSNINGNVVITQISNNSTSHSKDSTDSVHEIKLSLVKEESVDNTSVTNHEENCLESTQSPKAVRVTEEMKEENGNYLNGLKEESQVLHSTANEFSDSSSGREDSCLRNDEKNTEKTNQELPSGIVEINEACGIVSNANIEKEQSYNSVSNPEVETPKIEIKDVKLAPTKQDNEKLTNSVSNEEVKPHKIDFKDFRFTSTKLDNQNSSSSVSNEEVGSLKTDIKEFKFTSTKPDNKTSSGSNNIDLFFSELKDDPVDDYFNNAEISALLESLEELDLQFVTDEETEVSKQTNVDEPVIIETVTNGSPDEHLTVTANGTINSNSDSINICKETGSLEQSDSAEPLKHSDESDQLNSISPITSPSEAKLASPQSPRRQ
ncbi:hypothetical protein LSTR_LSTR014731 [Laodelphax striatellus]|uniref:NEDD4-binding protein 2-like 1 n=1 Tax=Laodelphax striatellus TaxID=195883 RepID=A0A482XDA1_LAOST|nr:hypothetical protein LSTR_LSTR014731 [Laodelphax striatellus]